MEDFPMWLKVVIWLIVGGTFIYAVVALLYAVFSG
jgi:hypothetical protein